MQEFHVHLKPHYDDHMMIKT